MKSNQKLKLLGHANSARRFASLFGSPSRRIGIIISAFVGIAFISIGCGRSDHVYADPAAASTTVSIEQRTLPSGLIDESTGTAKVSLEAAPSSKTDLVLRLQTPDGTGNRSLLGFSEESETKLKTLATLNFDAKLTTGTVGPTVLMIVDLNCDSANPNLHVLTAAWADVTSAVADTNGYSRASADFDQPHWKASVTAITDANAVVLLPSNTDSTSTAQSLTALLAQYPNACLSNSAPTSDDLTATQSAAIAFSIDGTGGAKVVDLNRIAIGSKVIDATTWGHQ